MGKEPPAKGENGRRVPAVSRPDTPHLPLAKNPPVTVVHDSRRVPAVDLFL